MTLLLRKTSELPNQQANARIIGGWRTKKGHSSGSCLVPVQVYWVWTNAQAISQASKICTGLHQGGFTPKR